MSLMYLTSISADDLHRVFLHYWFIGVNFLLQVLQYICILPANVKHVLAKQALGILCETVKDHGSVKSKHKGRREHNLNSSSRWLHLEESALGSFQLMCSEVVKLVDNADEESRASLKLAAISALEVLANRFPYCSVFNTCLGSVTNSVSSRNLAISSSSLRTIGALINVLGPKALVELPRIMENLIKKSHEVSANTDPRNKAEDPSVKESLMASILVTLEAVIDKLGGFLNPYLGEVTELLVLRCEFVSGSDLKLKVKADAVRRILTENIPVSVIRTSLYWCC